MRIELKFAMRKLWNHFARRVLCKEGGRGYRIFNVIDTRRKSRLEFLNEAQLPRFVRIFPCDRARIHHIVPPSPSDKI